jgi:hypothetical protein
MCGLLGRSRVLSANWWWEEEGTGDGDGALRLVGGEGRSDRSLGRVALGCELCEGLYWARRAREHSRCISALECDEFVVERRGRFWIAAWGHVGRRLKLVGDYKAAIAVIDAVGDERDVWVRRKADTGRDQCSQLCALSLLRRMPRSRDRRNRVLRLCASSQLQRPPATIPETLGFPQSSR